jgi:hypothetical protein
MCRFYFMTSVREEGEKENKMREEGSQLYV